MEPIPQFFDAVKLFAQNAAATFQQPSFQYTGEVSAYFTYVAAVADTLGSIARKELSNTFLSDSEINFLRSMLYQQTTGICGGSVINGWYAGLYYTVR